MNGGSQSLLPTAPTSRRSRWTLEGRVLEANRTALDFSVHTVEELRGVPLPGHRDLAVNSPTPVRELLRESFAEARNGKTTSEGDGAGCRRGPPRHHRLSSLTHDCVDAEGRWRFAALAEGGDITASKQAEDQLREVGVALDHGSALAARVARRNQQTRWPASRTPSCSSRMRSPRVTRITAYAGAIEREIGRIAGVTRQLYETYRPETDGARETSIPKRGRRCGGPPGAGQSRFQSEHQGGLAGRLHESYSFRCAVAAGALYSLIQNAVEASRKGELFR